MCSILASISGQNQSTISRALPRFARPCGVCWLKSTVKIWTKIPELFRFARPCGLFWLQYPVNFRAKFRELCLASLGHVVYFGWSLRSNLEKNLESSISLRSDMWWILTKFPIKIWSKIRELCLASLDHWVYFGFNIPLNWQQNFESYASLRSTIWLIMA